MARLDTTTKDEKLNVWLSPVLKRQVYKWAQSRGMNISEAVRYILRKETEND